MNLSIPERYALLEMLPREGSFVTIKLVRKLREKLSFTEKEIEEYQLKEVAVENGGMQVQWDINAQQADIEFTPTESTMIIKSLKDKDNDLKLTDREFPLYEKFVID